MVKSFQPRYTEPASVEVGDTIRVTWHDKGIEHIRIATVWRRLDDGDVRAFFTEAGAEIMHWIPGDRRNAKVVLMNRPERIDSLTELLGMEELAI